MKRQSRYLNIGSNLVKVDSSLLENHSELRIFATLINKIYTKQMRKGTGTPAESQFDIAVRKYRPSTFKAILKANPGMAQRAARRTKG